MASLKEQIIENVVKPLNNSSFGTLKGTVVNFDNYRNRADVEIQSPNGIGNMVLEKVPVCISNTGVKSNALLQGDYVWVTFLNGSPLLPKIIGIADEAYEVNTRESLRHIRQGSLMVDTVNLSSNVEITPLSETLLDEDNDSYNKHISYINFDVYEKASKFAQDIGYYGEEEIGITNPSNNSTVKVNDDGSIDIFSGTNHGIRVNPNTNEIIINSNKDIIINCSNLKINGTIKVNGEIIND